MASIRQRLRAGPINNICPRWQRRLDGRAYKSSAPPPASSGDGGGSRQGQRRRRGGDDAYETTDVEKPEPEEGTETVAMNATCSVNGLPSWSYMGGNEYLRFVRGLASRLKLDGGDVLLDLAAGDCGASALAIQQLFRGRLETVALLPSTASVHNFEEALQLRTTARHRDSRLGSFTPQINACVASTSQLGWLPSGTFDAAITFGAFSLVRSRMRLCSAYRAVLRAVRPGGRFIIADAEHPAQCASSKRSVLHDGGAGGGAGGSVSESVNGECGTCHWRAPVPLSFWLACTPMDLEVSVSAIEHTDLPGTATHSCASRHFALLAQRASAPHELRATVESGSDGGKVAILLSLSATSVDGTLQRRVQHLKETSIDNKRMYCGLHGYSLIIGEDLHHGRDTGWDNVKLLTAQHANYEWMLWVPVDAVFADTASSLGALTDDHHAQLIVLQDTSGDGTGTGVLTEPLLIRGKSEWSKRFLEQWWGFFADSFGGSSREALQLLLTGMHEEERARRVRIIQPEGVFTSVTSSEPLLWHQPYTAPALLVSFDESAAEVGSAAERASATATCPLQSSDRQMLRCLHVYTSHHLKAIQAADARYHPPAVFDVLGTAQAVMTTEDGTGADEEGAAHFGEMADTSAQRREEALVSADKGGGEGAANVVGGGGGGGGSGRGRGGNGSADSSGGDIDLAGGWLTPRISSGDMSMGGRPRPSSRRFTYT